MKLHLGCGSKILEGFVNVDIRQLNGVDVVEDIGKLDSFEDGSAHLIYACHVLEHVSRLHRFDVLKRWHDVLSLGGMLRIAVPDFQKVVELYGNGVCLEDLMGLLYGGQDYDYNFHCYCWDFESLKRDLKSVGFSDINKYKWRETEHCDVDDYSQAYWPHMEKETGLLVSLNVEAIK